MSVLTRDAGSTRRKAKPQHARPSTTAVAIPKILRFAIPALIFAGIGVIAFYLLVPTMQNGYNGDDALNSTAPMLMKSDHMSYMNFVVWSAQRWARNDGRFFPMSMAETALVFLVFTTRFSYKAYQLGIVLVDLALVAYVVGRATRNASAGYLTAFLAVLALQLRQFFDPIMLFSGQQQIVVALILGTVAFLWTGAEKDKPLFFIGAFVTWTVVLLTYETSYLLLPLLWMVLYFNTNRWRTRIIGILMVSVPTAALLVFVARLRSQHPSSSASYQFNFDPSAVSHTFVNQFSAALPLSYPALAHKYYPTTWDTGSKLTLVALSAICIAILAVILRGIRVSLKSGLQLTAIGLGMWALPSLVVAVTKGRQLQVTAGAGYVSEYLGYFGFAIVGAMIIAAVASYRRYIPKLVAVLLVILMGTGSGVAVAVTRSNNVVAAHSWDFYRYPREVFERSISRGVMSQIPADTVIANLHPGIWFNYSLIEWYGGPHIVKIEAPITNKVMPACKVLDAVCFSIRGPQWMSNHAGDADGGGVSLMAKIVGAVPNDADRPTLLSNDVYLYVESPSLKANDNSTPVAVDTQVGKDAQHLAAATLDRSAFTTVKQGDGWVLLHGSRLMTVDRLTVRVANTPVGALVPF